MSNALKLTIPKAITVPTAPRLIREGNKSTVNEDLGNMEELTKLEGIPSDCVQ